MQPTPILQKSLRRLALTTKQGPKDYYKGTGSGAMGVHTPNGGYKIIWKKVRTYQCPDLKGFKLTPFVTKNMEPLKGTFSRDDPKGPYSGERYLLNWKENNGVD